MAIITGGLGLLGRQHAEAIASAGGIPVLVDMRDARRGSEFCPRGPSVSGRPAMARDRPISSIRCRSDGVLEAKSWTRYGRVNILINNAANNPKMETPADLANARLENFPLAAWQADLAVGLTGAFVCSKVFGAEMARRKRGVILNVASDLAPSSRRTNDSIAVKVLPEDQQPVKPVTLFGREVGANRLDAVLGDLLGRLRRPRQRHLARRRL